MEDFNGNILRLHKNSGNQLPYSFYLLIYVTLIVPKIVRDLSTRIKEEPTLSFFFLKYNCFNTSQSMCTDPTGMAEKACISFWKFSYVSLQVFSGLT